MDKFGVPEPQWILDRRDSGSLYWRRDHAGNNSRVKFRCHVEVKEFNKHEQEREDRQEWPQNLEKTTNVALGMGAFLCVMITIFLPWYIIILGIN